MADRWLMDSGIKTRIEKVAQELIDTRGATQAEIKRFFASNELRGRMLAGFDTMLKRENTPVLGCMEEAQTD